MTVDYLCVLFCSGRENYMNRLSRCRFKFEVIVENRSVLLACSAMWASGIWGWQTEIMWATCLIAYNPRKSDLTRS